MKKIKTISLIALIMFVSLPIFLNWKDSHTDMSFNFDMGKTSFTQYTRSRYKKDSSPVYCYVDYIWILGQSVKMKAKRGDWSPDSY